MTREQKKQIIFNILKNNRTVQYTGKNTSCPPSVETLDDIRQKKKRMEHVQLVFGPYINPEDICGFCDVTIFSTGKAGMAFTTEDFYTTDLYFLIPKDTPRISVRYDSIDWVRTDPDKDSADTSAAESSFYIRKKDGSMQKLYGGIYCQYIIKCLRDIIKAFSETGTGSTQTARTH